MSTTAGEAVQEIHMHTIEGTAVDCAFISRIICNYHKNTHLWILWEIICASVASAHTHQLPITCSVCLTPAMEKVMVKHPSVSIICEARSMQHALAHCMYPGLSHSSHIHHLHTLCEINPDPYTPASRYMCASLQRAEWIKMCFVDWCPFSIQVQSPFICHFTLETRTTNKASHAAKSAAWEHKFLYLHCYPAWIHRFLFASPVLLPC